MADSLQIVQGNGCARGEIPLNGVEDLIMGSIPVMLVATMLM